MTREPVPLCTADISLFTRSLARELARDPAPSHLSLMNMLAKAGGFRNYQHLRAARQAAERLARPVPPPETVDHRLVERALSQFDAEGRLVQWPARRSVQELCLWLLWSRLPAGCGLSEREVNQALLAGHRFGDPAILRRSLFGMGLVSRNRDSSDYRRQEKRPPAAARELIRLLAERREAASGSQIGSRAK